MKKYDFVFRDPLHSCSPKSGGKRGGNTDSGEWGIGREADLVGKLVTLESAIITAQIKLMFVE
jgi:hypothetical protein